jgi:hypothetical protein
MSREVEAWARQQRTGDPARKAVLMALANYADPHGRNCYPSVPRIAEEVEVSARTVQRHIGALEEMGFIRRVERIRPEDGARTSNLIEFPDYVPPKLSHRVPAKPAAPGDNLSGGGDNLTPTHDTDVTGPGDTAVTPKKPNELLFPPSSSGDEDSPPKGGEPAAGVDEGRKVRRGARLPDDWTPPPIEELPQTVQIVLRQWPPGAYEFVAAQFVAHWHGESRANARKLDWDSAWVKWVTTESAAILRAARNGQKFTAPPAAEKSSDTDEAKALIAMHAKEEQEARVLRAALKADLGEQTYQGWLHPTFIKVDGGRLLIVASTLFMRDWLANNLSSRIEAVAERIGTSLRSVEFEVMR